MRLLFNDFKVLILNILGKLATWNLDPGVAVYSIGYGYDYTKTDS